MNKFNYFIAEDMKIDKDSKKSSDKTEENKVTNETVKIQVLQVALMQKTLKIKMTQLPK